MDGETSLQIVDSTSLSSAGVAEQHFKTKNPDIWILYPVNIDSFGQKVLRLVLPGD